MCKGFHSITQVHLVAVIYCLLLQAGWGLGRPGSSQHEHEHWGAVGCLAHDTASEGCAFILP